MAIRNEKASIKIDTSFYSDLGRMDVSVENAFKEFIDNSTSNFDDHKDELQRAGINCCEVRIKWDDNQIVIRDNAYGMDREEFGRALRLNDKANNYSASSRSQYGIGLKYAAANLGRKYSIESTKYHSNDKFYSVMDLDYIEKNSPEEVDLQISDVMDDEHYTEIVIKNLSVPFRAYCSSAKRGDKFETLLKKMSQIYSNDLRYKTLSLIINGRRVEYIRPEFMKDDKTGTEQLTYFHDTFKVNDKTYSYNGWVGFLKKGDTSGTGFALIQKGRAIQLNFTPEELFGRTNDFRYQRVIGEIELDGDNWIVAFTKSGMKWNNGVRTAFIESIDQNEDVKAIFDAAKKYRVKNENVDEKSIDKMNLGKSFGKLSSESTKKAPEKITKKVDAVEEPSTKAKDLNNGQNNNSVNTANVSTTASIPKTAETKVNTDYKIPESQTESENETDKFLRIPYEDIEYKFLITPTTEGDMETKWFDLKQIGDGTEHEYEILLNVRAPMFEKYSSTKEKELITKMCLVIVLAQLSGKTMGLNSLDIQKITDKINDIASKGI